MWKPIFHSLEFEYPNGYLFWDKAGHIARDLGQAIPGLRLRNQLIDQKEFTVDGTNAELLYGVRLSMLRSVDGDSTAFQKLASLLVEVLTEELELEGLVRWRIQVMVGWPSQTREEAYQTILKVIPKEALSQVAGEAFQAAQLETAHDAVRVTNRFSILDLRPPPGPALPFPEAGKGVPYTIVSQTLENFEAMPIIEFKVSTVLETVENTLLAELSKKTAAKTDELAD